MENLNKDDKNFVMGTTKPKNEQFFYHDNEADHHVKYKVNMKQQIYNDKRAIRT